MHGMPCFFGMIENANKPTRPPQRFQGDIFALRCCQIGVNQLPQCVATCSQWKSSCALGHAVHSTFCHSACSGTGVHNMGPWFLVSTFQMHSRFSQPLWYASYFWACLEYKLFCNNLALNLRGHAADWDLWCSRVLLTRTVVLSTLNTCQISWRNCSFCGFCEWSIYGEYNNHGQAWQGRRSFCVLPEDCPLSIMRSPSDCSHCAPLPLFVLVPWPGFIGIPVPLLEVSTSKFQIRKMQLCYSIVVRMRCWMLRTLGIIKTVWGSLLWFCLSVHQHPNKSLAGPAWRLSTNCNSIVTIVSSGTFHGQLNQTSLTGLLILVYLDDGTPFWWLLQDSCLPPAFTDAPVCAFVCVSQEVSLRMSWSMFFPSIWRQN